MEVVALLTPSLLQGRTKLGQKVEGELQSARSAGRKQMQGIRLTTACGNATQHLDVDNMQF